MAERKNTTIPAVSAPQNAPSLVDAVDAAAEAHDLATGIHGILCCIADSDEGIGPSSALVLERIATQLASTLEIVKDYLEEDQKRECA